MPKTTIYHSVDDDENKSFFYPYQLDFRSRIYPKPAIKEMKKEYPNKDIEVVEFS